MAIVYVWFPGEPGANTWGHMVAGHASLQTTHGYFSFWPRAGKKRSNEGLVAPEVADFSKTTLESDVQGMGWQPDATLPIERLDETAMMAGWTQIKADQTPYRLLDINCCTVTGHLLNLGIVKQIERSGNRPIGKYLTSLLAATGQPWLTKTASVPMVTPSVLLFFAHLTKDYIEDTGHSEDYAAAQVQQLRGSKGVWGFR